MRVAGSWVPVLVLIACGDGGAGVDEMADASAPVGAVAPRPTSTTLVITITEGAGGPSIPGRVVLYDEAGAPLRIGRKDMYDGLDQDRAFCELAPGVLGTWDGITLVDGTGEIAVGETRCVPSPGVPFGRYRLVALQGIEHEMFATEVDLTPHRGRVVVVAPLARAFTPRGALSADLHVHAVGSGDSTVPRDVLVISELVTGIQVIGASDHNLNTSYDFEIEQLGLRGKIASLSSNEASSPSIHANVMPAVVDPDLPRYGAPSGEELGGSTAAGFFRRLHDLPRSPFVQLNHPRLRFAAYFDAMGWNGRDWPPPMPVDFDGLETLSGWYVYDAPGDARLTQSLTDLFTLIEHGRLVTALGNSDTHHLSSILAGLPRNYVFLDDPSVAAFDEDELVDALRARRVLVTTGPWLELDVGGAPMGGRARAARGAVRASVTLRQASYVKATRMRLWVAGAARETVAIPAGAREWAWSGEVVVGATDTWIAVTVDGDEPIPNVLHGEYLGHRPEVPGMVPFALANPVLVDGDGDGAWRAQAAKPVLIPDRVMPARSGGAADECAPPGAHIGLVP